MARMLRRVRVYARMTYDVDANGFALGCDIPYGVYGSDAFVAMMFVYIRCGR